LVFDDDPGHVFTIKMPSTETVSILKKEIKKEKEPAFDHVPADTLVLWKVSILASSRILTSLLITWSNIMTMKAWAGISKP
jgi:hypothetical protein